VEVDGFTGAYRTRRVDIVHDVGDSLSPLIDLGQIEGGFVQGAGWLTLEDLRWDESDGPARGRLATQAASTYKLPSLSEMPEDFRVSLLEHAHEEGVVYGSKAVGEPPLMLAFSVREALRQAAAAFGAPGTSVHLASPATPEAVYWAIEQARAGGDTSVVEHAASGDGHVRDGHTRDAQVGDGHVGDGHVGDGRVGDGHPPDGAPADGERPDGAELDGAPAGRVPGSPTHAIPSDVERGTYPAGAPTRVRR
jgi:xanthine dehydrogenase large subunit